MSERILTPGEIVRGSFLIPGDTFLGNVPETGLETGNGLNFSPNDLKEALEKYHGRVIDLFMPAFDETTGRELPNYYTVVATNLPIEI